jgi:hypothetical protein
MKIVVLGAGASKEAGYPLAKKLMPAIKREAAGSNFLNLKTAWDTWAEFVRGQTGVLALLLNDPNPEVVLSALDLCAAATDAEGLGCFREEHADEALSQVLSDGQIPHDWWKSRAHEDLWRAEEARNRFVDCLLWFFCFKHQEDALPENRKRRDYLRDLLAKLDGGDVVVTPNWDTTVERTLAEEGRWNPLTGYGFDKDLQTGRPDALEALPAGLSKKSEIIVLKLHGSLGWHDSHGTICFSNEYFLTEFDFHYNQRRLALLDPASPSFGPDYSPVLAYPSFLKQLRGPQMQRVWHLATEAFRQAQEINIWGYSLPESDMAMRTLLNPLRSRLDEHQVQVFVHEPYDGEVRSRWREFLGNEARIDRLGLGAL